MLPKKNRIDKKIFKEVFSRAKNFHGKLVSLKIAQIEEENPRFAFVVPAKIAKKAVDRNKLKRRLRYIVAKILPSFKKNIAIMIFLKKGSEKLNFKELENEITAIFKKSGIL